MLTHLADHPDPHAEDVGVLHVDRLHRRVGRFEADAALFREPSLQRRFALVGQGDDDLALAGRRLAADDDVVAVGDLVLDHRFAVHLQGEQVAVVRVEHLAQVEFLLLLDRLVQHAGGNTAGQRQPTPTQGIAGQLDGPGPIGLA